MANVRSYGSARSRARRSAASSAATDLARVSRIARRIRFWAWVLVVLTFLGALAAFLLANTALSQVDAYGTVSVPGTRVVRFPAGEVDISFATNSAVSNGSFFTPGMSLDVAPASGAGAKPTVAAASSSASTIGSQTHALVFKAQVPNAGDYRVSVSGDTSAYINPQLLLGHGAPDGLIVMLGAIALGGLVLIIIVAGIVARRADKESGTSPASGAPLVVAPGITFMGSGITVSTPPNGSAAATLALGSPEPGPQSNGQAAHLDELSKLADLHERGVLTDAEFAAEKARILGG